VALSAFENPTSAPLIAPVITITPLPPLYYVCTFYIVRYTFFTTHPCQPTYTINELQKEKYKEAKERKRKKTTTNQNLQIIVIIIIIIVIIPILKSTTNTHIHQFTATFMCARSIAGALFDSARRFRASLLLQTTCVRSCCHWCTNCVAAKHPKTKSR